LIGATGFIGGHPDKAATLDEVLDTCDSYGFSFVGFSGEATGKFSMDELNRRRPAKRPLPVGQIRGVFDYYENHNCL
jgi:hypothetical protein